MPHSVSRAVSPTLQGPRLRRSDKRLKPSHIACSASTKLQRPTRGFKTFFMTIAPLMLRATSEAWMRQATWKSQVWWTLTRAFAVSTIQFQAESFGNVRTDFCFFMNSNSHNRCMPRAHALIRHKRLLKSAGPTMANYALWAPHGGVDVKNTLFSPVER